MCIKTDQNESSEKIHNREVKEKKKEKVLLALCVYIYTSNPHAII